MKKICFLLIALMVLSLPITSLAANDDKDITRAEFIKDILTLASIQVEEITESSFTDITDPQYISYIQTAYTMGIISGFGEEFRPDDSITKEQAIAIVVKIFGEKAGLREITEADINSILTFTDSSSISSWAKPYITYAIKSKLMVRHDDALYPKMPLTEKEASTLMEGAKTVFENLFTRDEMSASEMLILSNENNSNYNTYKQKGTMSMNMKVMVEGLSQEAIDDIQELKALLNQGIDMDIEIEVYAQNPDKAYIKEVIKPRNQELGVEQQDIEIFMDTSSMYTKMMNSDKWIMQDISSLMSQLQVTSTSSEPYTMTKLSDEQLKLFKEFARYEEDTVMDDKEYYVINMLIDNETYKEYYMEIVKKTMDSVVQMQMENPEFAGNPDFNPDQYKEMMVLLLSQMEVEIEYKYYVNKATKNYEKMWISQDIYMPLDNLFQMIQQMVPEEKIPSVSIKMLTQMEGEFSLYDFNEEVIFPVITPEDIMDTTQPQI